MKLQEKIAEDVKLAMKSRDQAKVETLRMIRAQLKDKEIEMGSELSEHDVLAVLNNAAKKRKEAIEMYEKSGREDLLAKERSELEIISAYLPAQLSEAEIEKVVVEIIQQTGAASIQELGKVMGVAMQQLKGKADGKLVQQIARQKLS